jgi:60 kDa SS-A/Ro ribonucleoprotein
MRLNQAVSHAVRTHEGGPAVPHLSPIQQLRRSVLSTLLWERSFYEDGQEIGERIESLSQQVDRQALADLAVQARSEYHLRHVPLLLLAALAKRGGSRIVSQTIEKVIQRPDELAEFLAIYWRKGKVPLAKQVKIGLANAFGKFDEYRLSKYNRDGAIKLRDVLFLVHARPADEAQAALWKRLVDGKLSTPDTWEVGLSSGADKKETFTRLLREGNLGYLALLRNLRNMMEAGVDAGLVREAILARKGARRVLPFRYVAAARACPQMEPALDQALLATIAELPVLQGKTMVLVDVSGSMGNRLSEKSDLTRMDAACALASMIPGDIRVFSFSNAIVEVPPRRGMAGVDAVRGSQAHCGTYLGAAVKALNALPHDRLIVITDEQSHDPVPSPVAQHSYMINVASNKHGVGYGRWTHLDGFSESVLRWIVEFEKEG